MKPWLVFLLVFLAVVVLVSPGIIGGLAERNLERNLEWAAGESSGIEIQTETFDRGWFTSEGRHRVLLSSVAFRAAADEFLQSTGNDALPSLIIDTRLDHGLIPFGDAGTLSPGLANMLSTFQIDPGNGELVALPGSLRSKVGLSGATESRFELEAGRFEIEAGNVEWTGADIALQTDWSDGTLIVDGTIEPFTVSSDDEMVRVGTMAVKTEQIRGAYGFVEGTASLEIESFLAESPGNSVAAGAIALAVDTAVAEARLSFSSHVSVAEIVAPVIGELSFAIDVAMNGLDAASMQIITRTLQDARNSPDPDLAMAGLFPKIEGELQNLASSGGEIRIDRLDVSLPQGKLTTSLLVDIPEGKNGADFSWASVLLKMKATADVRMPTALFEYVLLINPQANALVAMGFLQRDGEDYVMNAEYAQGLLNVNGAPLPIPMPGM